MKKVIIYGAGTGGQEILVKVSNKYEVICFADSDERKWGAQIEGFSILEPDIALKQEKWDYIIVGSAPGMESICSYLNDMNIPEHQIITSYVMQSLEARRQFLEDLSKLMKGKTGAVAEGGVFEGDFAKYINEYFPNSKCYLFDTFEGFAEQDVTLENEYSMSRAQVGDLGTTSVDKVEGKLKNKDMAVIVKGYFPDSAINIQEHFLFVNLDFDLYLPTKNGLEWLKNKMVAGGVVLVHDYFGEFYQGPKKAVDEFALENENVIKGKVPIGDGISIMLLF